ncbi:uncharacterized protein EMPS_07912 [Entomortierella parvispora]|uniref:HCP-like protein n=1 Tax=Entomortierella parvispora TaxID=205924 RepID=A0A9P3HF64_9FUNG|nr:uncharacterized protein EMPS_07912 [Entomortierella parvispora]
MIRSTAAKHAPITSVSGSSVAGRTSAGIRARRRQGTGAQAFSRADTKAVGYQSAVQSSRGFAQDAPRSAFYRDVSGPGGVVHKQYYRSQRQLEQQRHAFSTSTLSSSKHQVKSNKKPQKPQTKVDQQIKRTAEDSLSSRPPDPTSGTRVAAMMSGNPIEEDVVYRKDPTGKIVPVALKESKVESPVSGLFCQFEDFTTKPSSTPEDLAPRSTNTQEFDISTLTLTDVIPPDEFIEHLIKQKKMDITVDKIKELLQSLLDVLPLPEQDLTRLQVEREFQKALKKKNVAIYDLATTSLQYTRDGAPLAFVLFKMAMDQGDIYSRYSYAVMLYRGAKGVPADKYQGRQYLSSLAEPGGSAGRLRGLKGLPWAQSTLASIYAREDQDYAKAKDLYEQASLQGVVEAKVALARMYLNGELEEDLKEAKKYLRSAAQSDDNPEAHFLMGSIEMKEARELATSTESTSDKESKEAMIHNKTSKQLMGSGFQHYLKAASKGMVEAQYNVGQAYFTGMGGVVPKNEALAVEYWKMAGQQGFGLAQLSLGAYYFQDEKPRTQEASPGPSSSKDADHTSINQTEPTSNNKTVVHHVWDPSKKDLMQAQKWFTLASRRPGALGMEGKRLKAQVDEAIRSGGGASKRNGRMCNIM